MNSLLWEAGDVNRDNVTSFINSNRIIPKAIPECRIFIFLYYVSKLDGDDSPKKAGCGTRWLYWSQKFGPIWHIEGFSASLGVDPTYGA